MIKIPTPAHAVSATQAWVQSVVVGLNFCPFAGKELANNRIRYELSDATDMQAALELLVVELEQLDQHSDIETTLIIFTQGFAQFHPFLDLLDVANQLISDQDYEGIYQLASFHPNYCFADATADDPSNFTNRSPYPMLHIIREHSLEQALERTTNPEQIPQRNIQLAREVGTPKLQQLLDACTNTETKAPDTGA
ncbi:MAG: DUF1415 domain-containing protein [Pseudomonadales bacterium]|nr:DUF1415 domain-containing protein [Pseudomonadales bacterium]